MANIKFVDQQAGDPVRGFAEMVFVDNNDSDFNKRTDVENFSRLQSAANPFSVTVNYKIGDIVVFNDTLYRAKATVSGGDFDITQWMEINSAESITNVRNAVDLPDARTVMFTGASGQNGDADTRFIFSIPHGFLSGQTIQVFNSTVPAYDGFHLIKVFDSLNFDVIGLPFTFPATGTTTRCLANDRVYILDIPISTEEGYKQVDGATNTIKSSNTFINKITIASGGTNNGAGATATATVVGMAVDSIAVDTGGTGYLAPPDVAISEGGGNDDATARAIVVGGVVTAIVVTNGGTGFTSTPTVTLIGSPVIFKADTFGTLLLDDLLIESLSLSTGKLFDLDGVSLFNQPFISLNDVQVSNVSDIGNLSNMIALFERTTFANYDTGLILNDVPIQGVRISAGSNPLGPTSVFITMNNIIPFGVSTIFSGMQHFLSKVTDSIFFINPATPNVNRISIIDSGSASPGKYFDEGVKTAITSLEVTNTIVIGAIITASDSTVSPGVKTRILVDVTSQPVDLAIEGREVKIVSFGQYNGIYRASNVDTTGFDIDVSFSTDPGESGSAESTQTLANTDPLTLVNGDFVNIKGTNLSSGVTDVSGVTGSSFIINKFFRENEFFGTWENGTLTQTDIPIELRNVQDQLPSQIKGSIQVISNPTSTSIPVNDVYVDLNFGSVVSVSTVNQRFRLMDVTTAEIKYQGLEPFEGTLLFSCSFTKSGGSADYDFRGLKNNLLMDDAIEFTTTITKNIVSFSLPINAVTTDKFRIQVKRITGSGDLTGISMTTIIR